MVCCTCNGNGNETCTTCFGSGKVGTNACYRCFGTINVQCHTCNGSGNGPCMPGRRGPLGPIRKIFAGFLIYIVVYLFSSILAIGGNETLVSIRDLLFIPLKPLVDLLMIFSSFVVDVL